VIDPANITNYKQSHSQLEEFVLFWCFTAFHNAWSTARLFDKLLTDLTLATVTTQKRNSPFINIRRYLKKQGPNEFLTLLAKSGLGCYNRKSRTVRELAHSSINLKTCTAEDLEQVYGIGLKTSRCFLMHSRPNQRLAGLDTHILKFLRDQGHEIPLKGGTPTGNRYKELEEAFLQICDQAGKTPAQYDTEIWNHYSLLRKVSRAPEQNTSSQT
jgi:thermostable 8-oxoguanine DNA glycosylase